MTLVQLPLQSAARGNVKRGFPVLLLSRLSQTSLLGMRVYVTGRKGEEPLIKLLPRMVGRSESVDVAGLGGLVDAFEDAGHALQWAMSQCN